MPNKIIFNGINYSTRKPLIPPADRTILAQKIQQSLPKRDRVVYALAESTTRSRTFRSVNKHTINDIGDPKTSGWTYIINENDPRKNEIIKILKPLAEHRGMSEPEAPLLFNKKTQGQKWLEKNYHSLILLGKKAPYYVLIVGGPDMVPFNFQSMFDSAAAVGRVAFDNLEDLKTYVEKIINIEKTEKANPKEALVFATDSGIDDAPYYSLRFMAKPLVKYLQEKLKVNVKTLFGKQASKKNLLESLKTNKLALVYTASHGLAAPDDTLKEQKRVNGGIVCEETGDDNIFTADDIPSDQEPFLEGSIFLQFACYGYGTPAKSTYKPWLGEEVFDSNEDFIAAIPKRLLAHPKGPVAYIGHLDVALIDAFNEPLPDPFADKWHNRMSPFVYAVNKLLGEFNPVGISMEDMNKRYNICNSLLTSSINENKRLIEEGNDLERKAFLETMMNTFIFRGDAENYMVFGDPAVRPLVEIK